jgi:AcrR family transcriptional regulator
VSKPVATSRKRGPYRKSAVRQADIVDMATQAFSERGFVGTSVREIAAAVGMTQQGLSYHFPSKEALLEAVLQRRDEYAVQRFGSSDLPPLELLREVVRDANPGLVRLSTMLAAEATNPEHPAHDWFTQHFRAARVLFTRLVERGQGAGEIRVDVPAEDLARLLSAAFEGHQLLWLLGVDPDFADSFETVIRLLEPPASRPAKRRRARAR